jgi:hypothetical protein
MVKSNEKITMPRLADEKNKLNYSKDYKINYENSD